MADMGSPAFALKVGDRLRPFLHAGLTHVLRTRVPASNPSQDVQAAGAAHDFPSPWDAFLTKANVGAKVIFTYYELGLDLSGKADPRRGALFREILKVLGWAGKGVHSFWPMTAPEGETLAQSEPLFWQGAQHIGATAVVCFGRHSAQVVTGRSDPKDFPFSMHGRTVHLLPSPERMLNMLPHERHLAAETLRAIRIT